MPREVIYTDAAKTPAICSQAIKAAGLAFVSGTTPLDPKSGAIKGRTIQEQTHQCLANISATLLRREHRSARW
jgi:2-iminobutanoate/2-iminopropanoate deaminase